MISSTHLARRQTTALEDSGGEVRPWGEADEFRIRQLRRREGKSAPRFVDTIDLRLTFSSRIKKLGTASNEDWGWTNAVE